MQMSKNCKWWGMMISAGAMFGVGLILIIVGVVVFDMSDVAAAIIPALFTIVMLIANTPTVLVLLIRRRFALLVHCITQIACGLVTATLGLGYVYNNTASSPKSPCFDSTGIGRWEYITKCYWLNVYGGFAIGILVLVFSVSQICCALIEAMAIVNITLMNRHIDHPATDKEATGETGTTLFAVDSGSEDGHARHRQQPTRQQVPRQSNEIASEGPPTQLDNTSASNVVSETAATECGSSVCAEESSDSCCTTCCSKPECSCPSSDGHNSDDELSISSQQCETGVPPDVLTACSGSSSGDAGSEMSEGGSPVSEYATGVTPKETDSYYCF